MVLARQLRPVRKVVFMGMGEPSHNLANVLEAIEFLGSEGGLAHKQLVFSTVATSAPSRARTRRRSKPALALSLHTTRALSCESNCPCAPRLTPQQLVELADASTPAPPATPSNTNGPCCAA